MGEIALCQPLHDPDGIIADLKERCSPYPEPLRDALIRRFRWEILFSIENAEIAASRAEQTHIAGSTYRALACVGQVLFALNQRYLINEKGALEDEFSGNGSEPDGTRGPCLAPHRKRAVQIGIRNPACGRTRVTCYGQADCHSPLSRDVLGTSALE
jgi:hypothetical protein